MRPRPARRSGRRRRKLTIIDNEGPGTLDFSSSSYTVLEGAGLATVTVNRIGASNLKLSVDYATQTALTNPATPIIDYTPISPAQTLTFNPGEVSKTFQVAIADDSDAEGPENVDLVLSNPKNLTAGAAPQIGPNGPAELTINDDDVSTFNFSAPAYSVQEDDAAGHATITVNRSGATNIPASVDYSTSDGTATVAGSDYTAAAGTLNFAAGETTKTFDVDVSNDGAAEANETVNLTLTSGVTTVDTSLLSIVDNDNPKASVQLSSPIYNVNEADGTATVTVTLSHAVDADVTVDYATADGTALAGSDYTDTHGTLTFIGNVNNGGPGTGETSKTIQIPITQDPDAEDPETLTLTLSNALPGASSILGAPATGTVTIADDDPPGMIDFKSLHYDVDETDGQATVTVERLGGVGGAVSVDYETSDGSATAGSDYAATSGTLNWAAGDGADKTFTVPVTLGRPRRRHRVDQPGADEPRRGLRPGAEHRGGPPHRRRRRKRPARAELQRVQRRRGRRHGHDHRDALGRQPRRPGHGRLRDQRRHGDRGLRLRGRERHAHVRSGRGQQELHRPRDERFRARRRRDVPGDALERRRRREPRLPGRRHRDDHRRRRGARRRHRHAPGNPGRL